MWELVRANRRRSLVLVLGMLAILLVLGFLIGAAVAPSITASSFEDDTFVPGYAFNPLGGLLGMAVAFWLWGFQAGVAYFQGDSILLRISGARPIEKSDHRQLFNVVEEMTIAASLPKMPKIYIIEDMALNAFATGRSPETASVAVTAGLLGRLNRDQLQGVVAHEIAHIVNRDVLLMTMAGIMVGTVLILSEMFLRTMAYGGARYRGGNRKGGGGGQVVLLVLALVFAILAPLLAQLLYFAISRKREYLADAGSAVYTRYPEGLASALEILAADTQPLEAASRATAPMYIINPMEKMGVARLGWSRTHPPIQDRVRVLRTLTGGVSYAAYQEAMRKTGAHHAPKMPGSGLQQGAAPIRPPHAEAQQAAQNPAQRMREAGDLLRSLNNFLFLQCACGMRIKLPPDFKKDQVDCPRCQRHLQVPIAQLATAGALGEHLRGAGGAGGLGGAAGVGGAVGALPFAQPKGGQGAAEKTLPPLQVKRQTGGWMSVKCSCGTTMNIGPSFNLKETPCRRCGRSIQFT